MNKKIKEATKEEIAQAYKDNIPYKISNIKYQCYKERNNLFCDMYSGEIISRNGFNIYVAEKVKKGFEYRIYVSNKQRKFRLRERMRSMIQTGKAKFITMTFNPSFLDRATSEETRRRYISRFLKDQCKEYIANIDYGESEKGTHREHYHALVVPKTTNIDYKAYNDLFNKSRIYSEDVKVNEKSEISISLYINKLTNHSLKASGRYKRLIYSRS